MANVIVEACQGNMKPPNDDLSERIEPHCETKMDVNTTVTKPLDGNEVIYAIDKKNIESHDESVEQLFYYDPLDAIKPRKRFLARDDHKPMVGPARGSSNKRRH